MFTDVTVPKTQVLKLPKGENKRNQSGSAISLILKNA
jgi:hypothetical protein